MFRRIDEPGAPARTVRIDVDGRSLDAREGEPLAIALLAAGVVPTRRTPLSGAPRAPLCLMGTCFECLVQVDGRPNVQACAETVRDGMQVRLPQGARGPEPAP